MHLSKRMLKQGSLWLFRQRMRRWRWRCRRTLGRLEGGDLADLRWIPVQAIFLRGLTAMKREPGCHADAEQADQDGAVPAVDKGAAGSFGNVPLTGQDF